MDEVVHFRGVMGSLNLTPVAPDSIVRPSAHSIYLDVLGGTPACLKCTEYKAIATCYPCTHISLCSGCAQSAVECPQCKASLESIRLALNTNTPKKKKPSRKEESA
jgi:hypothetical protein